MFIIINIFREADGLQLVNAGPPKKDLWQLAVRPIHSPGNQSDDEISR